MWKDDDEDDFEKRDVGGARGRTGEMEKVEDIKYLFDFSASSYHRKKTQQKQCGFVVETKHLGANGIRPQ